MQLKNEVAYVKLLRKTARESSSRTGIRLWPFFELAICSRVVRAVATMARMI
jgi:hypothetical protein